MCVETLTRVELVYVQAADIVADPVHYVAGSAGQLKTSKEYHTYAVAGSHAYLTTYYYEDAVNPLRVTEIIETSTTV